MNAGGSIGLKLESTNAVLFRGYMTMAFDASNPSAGPIGTFSSVSDGQVIDCTTGILVRMICID